MIKNAYLLSELNSIFLQLSEDLGIQCLLSQADKIKDTNLPYFAVKPIYTSQNINIIGQESSEFEIFLYVYNFSELLNFQLSDLLINNLQNKKINNVKFGTAKALSSPNLIEQSNYFENVFTIPTKLCYNK